MSYYFITLIVFQSYSSFCVSTTFSKEEAVKGLKEVTQDVGVDMVTAFNFQNGAIKQALQANGGPLFYTCVDSSALQWSQILRQQLGC